MDYRAAAELDLPAGAYVIGLDIDNDASPDVSFDVFVPDALEGEYVSVFANNDIDGNPALTLLLPDGNSASIAPN